ncbi:MAG: hypothetical protein WCH78_04745 [Bacteroidota bacterium]
MKKILWIFATILIVAFVIFFYWRFYFVYAEGTKAGQLNTFQQKGILFKTYEGKIIQSGFKVNVESNYFEFSVIKESVAKALLENAGKEVELHYKRYFGSLPWRGVESYIVDSIYNVQSANIKMEIKPK